MGTHVQVLLILTWPECYVDAVTVRLKGPTGKPNEDSRDMVCLDSGRVWLRTGLGAEAGCHGAEIGRGRAAGGSC